LIKKKGRKKRTAGVTVGIILTTSLVAAAAVFMYISSNREKARTDFKNSIRQTNKECKDVMFKFQKASDDAAQRTKFGTVSEAAFVELGNSIADTYMPLDQQYYNEMVSLIERTKQTKTPEGFEECKAKFLSGLDLYSRAILQEVAALDLYHNTNNEKWNQASDNANAKSTTLGQGDDAVNCALDFLSRN
jgi:hypothetical protein